MQVQNSRKAWMPAVIALVAIVGGYFGFSDEQSAGMQTGLIAGIGAVIAIVQGILTYQTKNK